MEYSAFQHNAAEAQEYSGERGKCMSDVDFEAAGEQLEQQLEQAEPAEAEGTAGEPSIPTWLQRLAVEDKESVNHLRPQLEGMRFKVQNGKTKQEYEMGLDDLLNFAERGLDAETKWEQAAEARRFYEQYGPYAQEIEAALVLANELRINPQLATALAEASLAGAYEYNPQVAQLQAQIQQMQQQQQQQAWMAQQRNALEQQANQIIPKWPMLFDPKVAGEKNAELNVLKWQKEAESLAKQGIFDLDYALHRAFGGQLDRLRLQQYSKQKTQQGPSVGAGGTPAARKSQPKSVEEGWEQAERYLNERIAQAVAGGFAP